MAIALDSARLVIVCPGYGMAVAQAQHAIKEMTDLLTEGRARRRSASTPLPAACRAT